MRQARLWEGEGEGPAAPSVTEQKRVRGKPRVKPVDRSQMVFRAVKVDRLIREDHPARAIWAFVGELDLGAYYEKIKAVQHEAGRTALDPRVLVSLWVLAYSEGVSSAREVAALCEYDPAYQWLMGMTAVNHHTLSDFRVDHKEALDELFTHVLGLLSAEGLVSLERVMHDGTKVKAYASADTFRREGKVRAHLELARQQVEAMGDPRSEEARPPGAARRERAARQRKEKLELALEELQKVRQAKSTDAAKEEARVSQTEPECRMMKQGDGGYKPSYNAQITVEASHGIIVEPHLTASPTDYGEVIPAADRVKQRMGEPPRQMVTDGGCMSRQNILDLNERGIQYISRMDEVAGQGAGSKARWGIAPAFDSSAFAYQEQSDAYVCPAGKILTYEGREKGVGMTRHVYRAEATDCGACAHKRQCCPKAQKGRRVTRAEEDPVVAEFRRQMETAEAKAIYRQRGAVAEFVNAWLKEKIGLRQFRVRGLVKAGMELVWACLTYNIQQWIRLQWRRRSAQSLCAA